METRFNQVGTIIGQRGTGKSLFILGSEYSSKESDKSLNIPGIIKVYSQKKMKVLIIDTLDHPAYRKIPILTQDKFYQFKDGLPQHKLIARTYLEPDSIKELVNLINQSNHMNNTLIIFEDAGKYTEKTLPKPFKRLIIDSKQRNIDIIFMYHCFIDTPTNIFTKSDFIQLFKTEDSPIVRKNNLRLFDKVFSAYTEVKEHESNFFGKFIDTRTN